MCANSHVVGPILWWVVYGADVGHRVRCYGVEVGFGEGEGEREDVEEPFGEGVEGGKVAVEGWAPVGMR